MTGDAVNGRNGCGARAGARTLNLLAAPLNAAILRALQDGPTQQIDLRREVGYPPQTTLRAQLKKLCDAGTIEKRRRNRFPGVLEYELSEAGRDLLPVIGALDRWLDLAPEGPHELGSLPAKAAIKALTEGWSTTMLRALAAQPLTLTELDGVISSHNYPSLERRLAAMRLAYLVKARDGEGRGTPYEVTDWAQRSVGPIGAAVQWERCRGSLETAPLGKLDIETIFLLAVDLLSLPVDTAGSCRLSVDLRTSDTVPLAGLVLNFREGRVASRTTKLEGDPDAWASGPPSAWLPILDETIPIDLEVGGNVSMARTVADGLHSVLLEPPGQSEPKRFSLH